jgi:glycosyltransferase involved in cell wall biosynthesis
MSLSVLATASSSFDRASAEQLIGLARAGIDVEVLGAPDEACRQRFADAGIPIHSLKTRSRLDPRALRFIRRLIREKSYDVIHSYNSLSLGAVLAASRGTPVNIVGFRGYTGHVGFLHPTSWLGHLHPRVRRIICVSKAVERYFLSLRFLGWRVPPEKVVTIYKGHELCWYGDEPADLGEFGVPPGAFTVAFCGRDRPRKGLHVLVEAAGLIDPDYPIHYVLVGRMDSNRSLERQIAASPALGRMHFTGFRTDAPRISGACDAFALPCIRWRGVDGEGLSRAVLEAMAHGIPPIVTDTGGLPEQVEHGVSGFVVRQSDPRALADAIVELYRNPEQRRAMGRRSRQRIEQKFSCRRTVRETIALYEDVTRKKAS